ncbi:unnamed protein product, partial [marine sediment metagenome]
MLLLSGEAGEGSMKKDKLNKDIEKMKEDIKKKEAAVKTLDFKKAKRKKGIFGKEKDKPKKGL